MPNRPGSVNIFEFADYRRFLEAAYHARKAVDRKFSHRYISNSLRAGSTGWFADVTKGRANLSGRHIISLVRLLGLDSTEGEYFEALVRYDQAGSVEEKNLHYRRLLTLKGVKPEIVGRDRFEFYSEWYHSVIRELLFFHPFRGDYAGLAKMLHPPIGVQEARRSIKLLETLGFITRVASGDFRPAPNTLKKDSAFKSLHFSNFMKANILLGVESLEAFPKEERDISTMTLSFSPQAYGKAKEEIRALREKLLSLADSDPAPDRVYQFNFHAFPVSR